MKDWVEIEWNYRSNYYWRFKYNLLCLVQKDRYRFLKMCYGWRIIIICLYNLPYFLQRINCVLIIILPYFSFISWTVHFILFLCNKVTIRGISLYRLGYLGTPTNVGIQFWIKLKLAMLQIMCLLNFTEEFLSRRSGFYLFPSNFFLTYLNSAVG